MSRDFKKEYADYHGKPEQKKRRAQRNGARRDAVKAGKVRKGDGKDVHHVGAKKHGPLPSKTRVMSASRNRSIK